MCILRLSQFTWTENHLLTNICLRQLRYLNQLQNSFLILSSICSSQDISFSHIFCNNSFSNKKILLANPVGLNILCTIEKMVHFVILSSSKLSSQSKLRAKVSFYWSHNRLRTSETIGSTLSSEYCQPLKLNLPSSITFQASCINCDNLSLSEKFVTTLTTWRRNFVIILLP